MGQYLGRRDLLKGFFIGALTGVVSCSGLEKYELDSKKQVYLKNYPILDMDGNCVDFKNSFLKKKSLECGRLIDYLSLSKKHSLLTFRSYQCGRCEEDIAYIENIFEKNKDKLQVVGINMFDERSKSSYIPWTKMHLLEKNITFKNFMMSRKAMGNVFSDLEDFTGEIKLFPLSVIVDNSMRVVYSTGAIFTNNFQDYSKNRVNLEKAIEYIVD
ncbi:hypothetical protein ACFLZF_00305 [Nanoarchaeota archaeon]